MNVSVTDNSKWASAPTMPTARFNVDAVYQARDNITMPSGVVSPSATFWGDTQEWYVGGSFDLKMVKLMASWQGMDDSNTARNRH
jgi:predicted porin